MTESYPEIEKLYRDDLTQQLPKNLQTPYSQLENPNDKYEKRELYDKAEQEIVERHSNAFQTLLGQLNNAEETKKICAWDDKDIAKSQKIVSLQGYLSKEELPKEIAQTYKDYSTISWELVILHHRLIREKINRRSIFIEISTSAADMNDLYQQSLITAHNFALKHDPEKGEFSTYIGNYIDKKAIYSLLHNLGMKPDRVIEQTKSQKLLRNRSTEEISNEDAMLLAAALYYRRKPEKDNLKIDFEDDNYSEVVKQLKIFLVNPQPYNGIIKLGRKTKPKELRKQIEKYIKSLRDYLLINHPTEIHEDRNVQYRDTNGEIISVEKNEEYILAPQNTEEEAIQKVFYQQAREIIYNYLHEKPNLIEMTEDRFGFKGKEPLKPEKLKQIHHVSPRRLSTIDNNLRRKFRGSNDWTSWTL